MKEFKNRAELEALKQEFLGGVDTPTGVETAKVESEWGFSDLKRLNENQLADRLDSIAKQSLIMTWVICAHIRARFKSDREYGQFIQAIREGDPDHPLSKKQQSINRYVHAGRFVLRHKITNLNQIGLTPSAVYELSAPSNLQVADSVFKEVKKKGYETKDVIRKIEQAKAVVTIDKPNPVVMPYDRPPVPLKTIQVEDGKAVEEPPFYDDDDKIPEDDSVIESVPSSYPERLSAGIDGGSAVHREQEPVGSLTGFEDGDLILELASRDASSLSDEQAITDLLLFAERYKRSYMKLIPLFTGAAQQLKTQHLGR